MSIAERIESAGPDPAASTHTGGEEAPDPYRDPGQDSPAEVKRQVLAQDGRMDLISGLTTEEDAKAAGDAAREQKRLAAALDAHENDPEAQARRAKLSEAEAEAEYLQQLGRQTLALHTVQPLLDWFEEADEADGLYDEIGSFEHGAAVIAVAQQIAALAIHDPEAAQFALQHLADEEDGLGVDPETMTRIAHTADAVDKAIQQQAAEADLHRRADENLTLVAKLAEARTDQVERGAAEILASHGYVKTTGEFAQMWQHAVANVPEAFEALLELEIVSPEDVAPGDPARVIETTLQVQLASILWQLDYDKHQRDAVVRAQIAGSSMPNLTDGLTTGLGSREAIYQLRDRQQALIEEATRYEPDFHGIWKLAGDLKSRARAVDPQAQTARAIKAQVGAAAKASQRGARIETEDGRRVSLYDGLTDGQGRKGQAVVSKYDEESPEAREARIRRADGTRSLAAIDARRR